MSRVWRTIKGYLFWTYDRGSFHYDVMVTLILVFIFVAPRFIDFRDKPASVASHQNEIIIQLDAASVDAQDQSMVRTNFQKEIRRLSGTMTIERIEPVRDQAGQIVAYRAWVRKEKPAPVKP